MIGYVIGRILLTEAGLLALPAVTTLSYGESLVPFLATETEAFTPLGEVTTGTP